MKFTLQIFLLLIILVSCKEKADEVIGPNQFPLEKKYDLRSSLSWKLSNTPLQYEESALVNDLGYGFNRANISWYIIDPSVFYDRFSNLRPENVTNAELSDQYVRQVTEPEVFPENDIPNGTPTNIMVLNINYFPEEKGPYNYESSPTEFSSGMNESGELNDPNSRWGGIMRNLDPANFEMKYLKFILMDPFVYDENISGELYFNIGFINEDILRDGKHANEASINLQDSSIYDTTAWGIVNATNSWHYNFGASYREDYGYDGLDNEQERSFFSNYLNSIQTICSLDVFEKIFTDPSGDDYHPFRGDYYDTDIFYRSIIEKYKKYPMSEGNSDGSVLFPGLNFFHRYSFQPNVEDLNGDQSLNTENSYFEYQVKINVNEMDTGFNYIEKIFHASGIRLPNGEITHVKWYYFKIPIEEYTSKYGNISLNSNFETMRIYLTNFDTPVVLRFAALKFTEE